MIDELYCQHTESDKYEGEHGWGTVATIVCELYERQDFIESTAILMLAEGGN
jgi:hypothetical protein